MKEYVFLTDSRDNNIYKTVVIGTQTWMAENLNYDPETGNSNCYSNQTSNCDKYGRLYDWAIAMWFNSNCNSSSCSSSIQSKHKGICPDGWHIPSSEDWGELSRYVDGTSGTFAGYDSPTAGKYLKATIGWNNYGANDNGTDQYGFSALPGGSTVDSYGNFGNAGYYGVWWSANERENLSTNACYRSMVQNDERAAWSCIHSKSWLLSVRCVKDD